MTLGAIRALFILLCALVGGQIPPQLGYPTYSVVGAISGAIAACVVIILELILKRFSVRGLGVLCIGLLLGGVIGNVIGRSFLLFIEEPAHSIAQLGVTLVFSYLGMVIAYRGRDEFNVLIPYVNFSRQNKLEQLIVVDTSVIIDGRILDVCETGFIEGRLIIPRFVLLELQNIADSSDSLKRNRGRRGLDILNKLQENPGLEVKIHEADFPDISEVDSKLVKLAKILDAKIFTNDYNLNKVAELQQVRVLNINDLAKALKPVVLPGEMLNVRIVREGKEPDQGVAYLDDGTMVVVNDGRNKIGQRLNASVTSVLQTSAGRMIFAEIKNETERAPDTRGSRKKP